MAFQEGTVYFKNKDLERIDCKITPVNLSTAQLSWTGTSISEDYDGYYHAYCEFVGNDTIAVYRRKKSSQVFVHWEINDA